MIEFVYRHKKRKTGEGYVTHLYAVKRILQEEGVSDPTILNAALLHDVLEDTQIPKEYLAIKFGKRVADIVWVLSKDSRWKTDYCKMKSNLDEIAMEKYPAAMLIKMADRLHNLQTIHGFLPEKQQEYLDETKQMLVPVFKNLINKMCLGELRNYGVSILRKLNQEIRNIEYRNLYLTPNEHQRNQSTVQA